MTQISLTSQSWKKSSTRIQTGYQKSQYQSQGHLRSNKLPGIRKYREQPKPIYTPLDNGILTLAKHQKLIIAAIDEALPELIETACHWDSLITINEIVNDSCKISVSVPQAYGFKIAEVIGDSAEEPSPIIMKRISGQSIVISPIDPEKNLDEIYEVVTTDGLVEMRIFEIDESHVAMACSFNKKLHNVKRLEVIGFKDSISTAEINL
jgi:hypothetical protein